MGFLQTLTTATLGLSILYTGSNANLIERQALGPPATLPTGWSYKGCYTDAVGQRSLQAASFAGGNQNAEECIDFCSSAGYSLAGTEYSSECYCGNAIATPGGPAPNGEGCNMACSGAPGEACGGPDRLSVYERSATPPAQSSSLGIEDGSDHIWIARGCYSDLTYARILAQSVGVQGGGQNNSALSCTAECRRQNFRYAGTEYAQECFCGNTLNNNHEPKDEGCNMRCTGNSKQFCGGPDRINIYEYVEKPTSTSSSSISSTASTTPLLTATTESSSTITSSSSVTQSTSSEDHVSTSSSSFDSSSSSSASSASTSEITSRSASASSDHSSSTVSSDSSSSSASSTSEHESTTSTSSSSDAHSSTTSDDHTTSSSVSSSETYSSSSAPTTSDHTSKSTTSEHATSTHETTSTVSEQQNSTTSLDSHSSTATSTQFNSTTSDHINATSTVLLNSTSTEVHITSTDSATLNLTSTDTVTHPSSTSDSLDAATTTTIAQNTTTSTSADATITDTALVSSTESASLNATITDTALVSSTESASLNATTSSIAQNTTASISPNATITESANDSTTSTVSLNTSTTASVELNSTTLMLDVTTETPTPTPEPKTGWHYEGCYVDGAGGRSLPNGGAVQGQMTNDKCRNACRAAGYVLAGTEYAAECFCGNALVAGGAPAPDGETQCNMACNGNQTEICGGPNRLSLWRFYTGNEPPPSSTTAASSSSAAPVPTGLPTGFEYKGCYVDGPGYRVMQNQQPGDDQMTVASCASTCARQGYDVAGMEYHTQCFCDTMLRMGAYLANNDNECNTPCGGNSAQMCGGGDRLSVYSSQTTLKIIKKPGPIQTVGNWTYQGCATSTGLDWNKPLPWKIANETGNSPEWCLDRCAKYGYMAGGMEYGSECYCGDVDHMVEKGSQPAPETDCNTPCPGNAEAICGQGNRLTWYKWTGDPLYTFSYPQGGAAGQYSFLVGSPVIPLISQPLVNGKVSFLEKHGTGPNGTGAYELDPSIGGGTDIAHAFREMVGLKTDVFCAASLTLPDRAGRVINVGGWSSTSLFGLRLYWPDGQLGTNGTNDWQESYEQISLQTTRWYPTSLIMPNGSILVVGGENGSNGPPVPNMEILPQVGPLKHAQYLADTDPYNLYPFLAVLPSSGIFIHYYNEARILDERTLDTIKILPKAPGTVTDDKGGRTYPLEGTMVLLPQVAPYSEPLEVLLCGGAGIQPAWGIDNCITMQPDAPNPEWTLERMPSRRVLTCMTTLPDGTFLILNGAEEGVAGFGLADKSNFNAVLYDPKKPKHHRMSVMANTTIARMYHSEAVLLDDGRVLVSGSDPEDDKHPQEYRLEVFQPPYLLSGKPRPAFTIENKDWINGVAYPFTVTSGGANIKVSLLGSEASTHGNSMGARVLFPTVSCGGSSCTVTAPPGPYVAPPGWYRMFVLSDDVPSHAAWVRIGGDPGRLGEWPNLPAFQPLPGVGPVNGLNTSPSAKTGGQKFRA